MVSRSALIIGDVRPWVRASVTSTLSLHDLIDPTIRYFELCVEQKNGK